MRVIGSFEKAKRYIESQPRTAEKSNVYKSTLHGPCITISREAGAGADRIGDRLINFFQKYKKFNSPDWTLFDRNLIEKVLRDHNLPLYLSELMGEEKFSDIKSIANELLGGQPNTWTLVHDITETILQLANVGNVIIIGRAANFITFDLNNTFHIRLVSVQSDKIQHVMKVYNLNRKDAEEFMKKENEDRRKYVKTYFNKNIDDLMFYHLTINTHLLSDDEAAEIIGNAVLKRFPRMFNL